MTPQINYFYIDESGHLNNNSNIFILGCIKTESPEDLTEAIRTLIKEINEDLYFSLVKNDFNTQGFHAVENHPDIRTKLYSILPLLNYRSYFVILNKKDIYYNELSKKYQPHEVYKQCLYRLLKDRIISSKNDKNVFIFEELTFEKCTLAEILDDFFKGFKEFDIEYKISSKAEKILSLIDYLNYILYSILNDTKKTQDRMMQNFELIKPKIASIYYINNKSYFSRHKKYSLQDLIKLLGGVAKG
ncbi:MAG TPA: DUF3800 domain-containing protein [Cytophagaceae bacterium]|jgi:CDP-glycerol glycerophosphotransferase (TagB/SpsB family)|nr:DUF3800 domain-containing protein [Cytophagaceae bacterium]